jgi:Tfp pilus assembly protein PilX
MGEMGRGSEWGNAPLVVASARPRGQQGSILLLVLTVVLVLSIAVVGILNYSLNTDIVANELEQNTRGLYAIDGAMEEAVNAVRNDDTVCASALTIGDYEVSCATSAEATPVARRTVDLIATPSGSSDAVARARVRVVDEVNGQELLGYSIEVCDWLLADAVTETLQGCSA